MAPHVTAVCSGKNADLVYAYGADEFIDYTKDNFADVASKNHQKYDRVFDFVGGLSAETSGIKALKKSGRFITVTGPQMFIGEEKLAWSKLVGIFSHMAYQYIRGRLIGPRYIFGEMNPSKTIKPALKQVINHDIKIPISRQIPFEIEAIKQALELLMSHRAQGRMVINFEL